MVYGLEAMLPTDVAFGAPRIQFYEEGEAEQTRCVDLDSLEEQSVGGFENRMESLNTRITNRSAQVTKDEETKNLRKPVLASKVVNPFTRALAPSFIGRQRDFLHPENTLRSREYS
jgi:hypothetical protein